MRTVAVVGCDFHLGPVVAACLAELGHDVVGHAENLIIALAAQAGQPRVSEPGLTQLIERGVSSGKLRFTDSYCDAVANADVVIVAWDTPVDDNDEADPEYVLSRVRERVFPHIKQGATIVLMSQLPIGSCARLERACVASSHHLGKDDNVRFAVLPENLRLGTSLSCFYDERWIVGARTAEDHLLLANLLTADGERGDSTDYAFVSPEEAEMAKHARNGWLAMNIAFGNEVACLSARVGADGAKVARCLKLDPRVGAAPISPGAAVDGGTLMRDVGYLSRVAASLDMPATITSAVRRSNDHHKAWVQRKLLDLFSGDLTGRKIAVWGIAYKAGTDTLRRSGASELIGWLESEGAIVATHDPAHNETDPRCSAVGASAVVIQSPKPEYKTLSRASLDVGTIFTLHVIDPHGSCPQLDRTVSDNKMYHRVGAPL